VKIRKSIKLLLWASLILGLCGGTFALYDRGRPVPIPMERQLYKGITYRRIVHIRPHALIIHIVVIDTQAKGIQFFVTPPDDPTSDAPMRARKTTQFLDEFDLQLAINGGIFTPWWSHSPLDYYPHVGDSVSVRGETASSGLIYAIEQKKPYPTLYISEQNQVSFDAPEKIYNAISGHSMLVLAGEIVTDRDDPVKHPRTMIGLSKDERFLYLVIVDGRQPYYSEGTDLEESAQLMIDLGAYHAMNMDGGGSSTLVIEGVDGKPVILNSPIDNYIPGRERPVANHLGIYVSK